jgi:hypothetical protein
MQLLVPDRLAATIAVKTLATGRRVRGLVIFVNILYFRDLARSGINVWLLSCGNPVANVQPRGSYDSSPTRPLRRRSLNQFLHHIKST